MVIVADPILRFFVLIVRWVFNTIQQMVKASDTSTVFSFASTVLFFTPDKPQPAE
jgi:hypothetical protein